MSLQLSIDARYVQIPINAWSPAQRSCEPDQLITTNSITYLGRIYAKPSGSDPCSFQISDKNFWANPTLCTVLCSYFQIKKTPAKQKGKEKRERRRERSAKEIHRRDPRPSSKFNLFFRNSLFDSFIQFGILVL